MAFGRKNIPAASLADRITAWHDRDRTLAQSPSLAVLRDRVTHLTITLGQARDLLNKSKAQEEALVVGAQRFRYRGSVPNGKAADAASDETDRLAREIATLEAQIAEASAEIGPRQEAEIAHEAEWRGIFRQIGEDLYLPLRELRPHAEQLDRFIECTLNSSTGVRSLGHDLACVRARDMLTEGSGIASRVDRALTLAGVE